MADFDQDDLQKRKEYKDAFESTLGRSIDDDPEATRAFESFYQQSKEKPSAPTVLPSISDHDVKVAQLVAPSQTSLDEIRSDLMNSGRFGRPMGMGDSLRARNGGTPVSSSTPNSEAPSFEKDPQLEAISKALPTPNSNLDLQGLMDRFSASSTRKLKVSGPAKKTESSPMAPASPSMPAPVAPNETNELDAAIKDRNDRQLAAALLKAGSQLGNAFARTDSKIGTSAADSFMKLADQSVTDVKDKQKLKSEKTADKLNNLKLTKETGMMDPNSKESQSFRQSLEANFPGIASKYGDMWKDVSAADQSLVFEPLKLAESIQARKDLKAMQMEAIKEQRSKKTEDKDRDRLDKMSKLITAEVSSSRGAFGKAAVNKQGIENAEALIQGHANLDEIPNTQLFELARALDRVVSTGSPTISGTEHLTPDTMKTRIADKLQFISGNQRGANAGTFVKTMSDSLDREKTVANRQLMATQKSLLSSYKDLQQNRPEEFNFVLGQHGLPTSIMDAGDKSTAEKKAAPAPKASITRQQLKDYATKHKMDEEKAQQFLTGQGYVIK